MLYDLYETSGNENNNNNTEKAFRSYETYQMPYTYRQIPINLNLQPSISLATSRSPTQQQQQQQNPHQLQFHGLRESSAPPKSVVHVQTYVHDSAQNYLEQSLSHHPSSELTAADRRKLATIAAVRSFRLIKGQPLFVELDFVPKFIPSSTFCKFNNLCSLEYVANDLFSFVNRRSHLSLATSQDHWKSSSMDFGLAPGSVPCTIMSIVHKSPAVIYFARDTLLA